MVNGTQECMYMHACMQCTDRSSQRKATFLELKDILHCNSMYTVPTIALDPREDTNMHHLHEVHSSTATRGSPYKPHNTEVSTSWVAMNHRVLQQDIYKTILLL